MKDMWAHSIGRHAERALIRPAIAGFGAITPTAPRAVNPRRP